MVANPSDITPVDRALIASAFTLIAERGWARFSVAEAARAADVPLEVARLRLPGRCALLMRFGALADSHALTGVVTYGTARDRLFDVLMRRIDLFQSHRAGVLALLRALPADPLSAAMLGAASLRSMGWMLEAAGVAATGPIGALRAKALLAAWVWTLRAWDRDATEDLAPTMAALDQALARCEKAAGWLGRRDAASPAEPPASPENTPASPENRGPDHAE